MPKYIIDPQEDGSFICYVIKDKKKFGEPFMAINYESVIAWLDVIIGTYARGRREGA